MKMKKFITFLVVISTFLLVACDSSDDNITVAIWDTNQQPGLQLIIDEFTEETGIEVELQVIPGGEYWTLLEAGVQGGDMPDVFWMHSDQFQMFADNEILLDLTEKIDESEILNLDGFFEDIVELYNFDGQQFAVPKDIDTIALWYNRTMFEEAGVATPDETWTWETLLEAAEALTLGDGSQYGIAWNVNNGQEAFYNVIYSMGGYVINDDQTTSGFDNPNTIEAMEFVDRLIPTMPSIEEMSENGPHILFPSGMIAMATQGSWMVSSFSDNDFLLEHANVAVLPMAADGTRVSIYNGLGWAAAADGPNTEDAWRLIEWFSTEDMQRRQAELGVTMAAFEGTSDDWANSVPEFNLQAYLDMTENMVILPHSRNTQAWTHMFADELIPVWMGERDMEEVLIEISEEMNRLLDLE